MSWVVPEWLIHTTGKPAAAISCFGTTVLGVISTDCPRSKLGSTGRLESPGSGASDADGLVRDIVSVDVGGHAARTQEPMATSRASRAPGLTASPGAAG